MTKPTIVLTVALVACLAIGLTVAEEVSTDTSGDASYALIAKAVGRVIKGLETMVNTFVFDPSFRDHLLLIQKDVCTSFKEALLCYRSSTIDFKFTSSAVHVVRDVAAELVSVLDSDAVVAEKDGGPILDFANQLVHVFAKRPDLGRAATESFITFYKAASIGCDCFQARLLEKRADFFFLFRPFIESIRHFMALPLAVFTGFME